MLKEFTNIKNKTYTADDVPTMCKRHMNETHIKFIEKAIYFLRHMLISTNS